MRSNTNSERGGGGESIMGGYYFDRSILRKEDYRQSGFMTERHKDKLSIKLYSEQSISNNMMSSG